MQGLLELAGVPYVGSGVLASALCMDKVKAKEVLAAHGLPQVPYVVLRDTETAGAGAARRGGRASAYPLFVKPANLGSSVGVTKVHDAGRAGRGGGRGRRLRRVDGRRGGRRRPGDRGRRCSATPSPGRRCRARSCPATSSTTTRTSTSTAPASCWSRPPSTTRRPPRCATWRCDAYRALRCDGHGPGRLLLRGGRPGLPRQRGQHDPRVHPGVDVPEAVGGVPASPTRDLIDELVRLAVERHEHRSRGSPPSADERTGHRGHRRIRRRNWLPPRRSDASGVLCARACTAPPPGAPRSARAGCYAGRRPLPHSVPAQRGHLPAVGSLPRHRGWRSTRPRRPWSRPATGRQPDRRVARRDRPHRPSSARRQRRLGGRYGAFWLEPAGTPRPRCTSPTWMPTGRGRRPAVADADRRRTRQVVTDAVPSGDDRAAAAARRTTIAPTLDRDAGNSPSRPTSPRTRSWCARPRRTRPPSPRRPGRGPAGRRRARGRAAGARRGRRQRRRPEGRRAGSWTSRRPGRPERRRRPSGVVRPPTDDAGRTARPGLAVGVLHHGLDRVPVERRLHLREPPLSRSSLGSSP